MNVRETLNQSLKMFKDSSRNAADTFGLVKGVIRSRNIDNRLKLNLVRIIPAFMQTNLFSKEAVQTFIETVGMRIDTDKNDIDLVGCNGYQLHTFSKNGNNDIKMSNYIAINKKGGIRDNTITHESIHGMAQSFTINHPGRLHEYSAGFRMSFYNDNFEFAGAVGTAFNEGFTEMVTSRVLNKIPTNKVKTKIKGVERNLYGVYRAAVKKAFNKRILRENGEAFNPYGFQYDEFDNKRGGDNYTVYKKMAELLEYASGGQASKYFAKGDLDGFNQEFDSVKGAAHFKNLLATMDGYHYKYEHLKKQFNEKKIKYRDIFKDQELKESISNCTDTIIDYFSRNVERHMNKDTKTTNFISKLVEFEKMLPKEIDKTLWNENKNRLLYDFIIEKQGRTSRKNEKNCFAALDVYYNDCLKDKSNLKKKFEYQTMTDPKRLNESMLIINNGSETRIFSVDLFYGFDSYSYDELLTEDLNTKETLTQKEQIVKEKLDESFLGEKNNKLLKKKAAYLAHNDYIFVAEKEGLSAYSISEVRGSVELEKLQLGETKEVGNGFELSKGRDSEQSKLNYLKNVQSLYKNFEKKFTNSKAR